MSNSVQLYLNIAVAQSSFSFPFPYLEEVDITAYVDGVSVFANNTSTGTAVGGNTYVVAFSAPNSGTLTFSPAVVSGSDVRIERNTNVDTKVVDFADGAVLTEVALDSAVDQLLFGVQEAIDTANASITLTPANRWDAGGSIINNVGTPTATTDAATKAYADGISAAASAAAVAAANAAVIAATNDLIPDATKLAIHPIGSQYTLSDGVTTDFSAKHYQDGASTSATNAAASETNAATSETNAQDWAVKTTGIVEAIGYSAKAWSVGGTDVTNTAGAGASQEWATKTTTNVDGTEFSSKEYAVGTQVANTDGSAKQWALGGANFDSSVTVDGTNYSAKYWADVAASSVANFDDKYYGNYATDAAAEDAHEAAGYPVAVGDLYFNTTSNVVRYCQVAPTGAGAPVGTWADIATQNLSNYATAGFSIAMSIAL